MIDVQEKKRIILQFLEENGPSLPVHVSRKIKMDPVFASAILSELLNDKKIVTSHMRVGSSPLYLLEGSEEKLEAYADNLKSVEKEALKTLKEEGILRDSEQEPAIRVALRNIKDFTNQKNQENDIIWEYRFNKEKSERKSEEEKEKIPEKRKEETIHKTDDKEKEDSTSKKPSKHEKKQEENEEGESGEQEEEREEEKPEFYFEVKKFLKERKSEIEEEIQIDKKEVEAKIRISSGIGNLPFLLIAKNKKTTNKDEIHTALQRSKYHMLPCLFVIRKEPPRAIQKILEENKLIRIEVLK